MLDFYLIPDGQTNNSHADLKYAGGIKWEEFDEAQVVAVIESHLDYYGKFRWSNELVRRKITLLKGFNQHSLPNLTNVLEQANAAGCGLVAYGD